MSYISTRGLCEAASGCEAMLRGLAPDGGLYVPAAFPRIPRDEIESAPDYPALSARVLTSFFPEIAYDDMLRMCEEARALFDAKGCAPLARMPAGVSALELFHGPTLAFKDIALTMLPRLMAASARVTGQTETILLLVATSGDTGKAALEGFCDAPGTRCVVYYPENGVSPMQKAQMATQRGENTHVVAVTGNFDSAQTGVKKIFSDPDADEKLRGMGYRLSSANSINIGRLAPQIAYYFSSYVSLVREGQIAYGDRLNFAVPTGNFGDILAGYYAMRMGLPVGRLICASNANNVLTDFFQTGVYDARRSFKTTSSPSMDILISSNLERLLFETADRDAERVRGWMRELAENKVYDVGDAIREKLSETFAAGWADENAVRLEISNVFQQSGYLMDPHTAVASRVLRAYREHTGDNAPCVLVSTASPYKFPRTVASALLPYAQGDDFQLCQNLARVSGRSVPEAITALRTLPVRHRTVCKPDDMLATLYDLLPNA